MSGNIGANPAFLIQLDIGRYQFVGVVDAINSYVKSKKLSRVI
ncbi:traS domain protein [Escherichia coli]|nr:traS domain protein [Escherichia coli]